MVTASPYRIVDAIKQAKANCAFDFLMGAPEP